MGRVVIGMDPHKRSATIEIINHQETVLAAGRFGTDRDGYRAMLAAGRRHPERIWTVEGCYGIGRHIAQRLVANGETVVDVPPKLSAGSGCSPPAKDARPTRSTRTVWPWRRYAPRVCGRSPSMTKRWRCGCSSTAATNSDVPAPTCSTASTNCCWSYCLAERRRSYAPTRPAPYWPPSAHATSSVAPAGAWLRN
jgi:hypothetical protein